MRGHRILTLALAGLLTVGSLASCSSSKKSDDNGSKDSGSNSGSSNTSSSNPKVKDYCAKVDAFVKKVQADKSDPTKLAGLSSDGQALAQSAAALTGIGANDAKAAADCTTKSTDALKSLTGG
ncbi:MAG TPA: hypothetical protein VGM93_01825 [Acidimicrobiales bacterium]